MDLKIYDLKEGNDMKNTVKEYRTAAAAEVNRLLGQGLSLKEIAKKHPVIWTAYQAGPPATEEGPQLYKGVHPSAEMYRLQKAYMQSGDAETVEEANRLIAENQPQLYEIWLRGR